MKHVHSADPRKPEVVAAFKHLFSANKVTELKEVNPTTFQANLLGKKETSGPYAGTFKQLGFRRIHQDDFGGWEQVPVATLN